MSKYAIAVMAAWVWAASAAPAVAGGYVGLAFGPGTDAVAEVDPEIEQSASGAMRLALGYRFPQFSIEAALWRAGAQTESDAVVQEQTSLLAPGLDAKFLPVGIGGLEGYIHAGLYFPSLRRELTMIEGTPDQEEIVTTIKRESAGAAWSFGFGAQFKFGLSGKMQGALQLDLSRYVVEGESSNGILVGVLIGGGL